MNVAENERGLYVEGSVLVGIYSTIVALQYVPYSQKIWREIKYCSLAVPKFFTISYNSMGMEAFAPTFR